MTSADAALREYAKVVMAHPRLSEALAQVERRIALGLAPQLVLLIGSTRVGKTTLLDKLEERCRADGPVARMVIHPPGGSGFQLRTTHWQTLARSVGDPCPADHLAPSDEERRLRDGGGVRQGKATVEEQRLGVLRMLRARRVRVVMLDEAHYMTRATGGGALVNQLDVIKDSVDRSGIHHVLAGTYELSAMVVANEQLGCRTRLIHFRPYYGDISADREAFQGVFADLVTALPGLDAKRTWKAIGGHVPDIYTGSVGCVGLLKHWLTDALQAALASGAGWIDWPVMEDNAPLTEVQFATAERIREYRDLGSRRSRREVEKVLGLSPAQKWSNGAARKTRPSKPGRRRPSRDAVGLPSEQDGSGAEEAGRG